MPAVDETKTTLLASEAQVAGRETNGDRGTPRSNVQQSINQRYRAPGLLAFGGFCAVVGFFLITVIGLIDFKTQKSNSFLNVPYKSGVGYWPSTVSEMVHNHESPGGKLFYTFGMIAGVCIFSSFYPFNLRNVYTGDECVPFTSMYWTTFRQICPSMGLWLLIGVNTYPTKIALASHGFTKMFCVFLHLTGAGMMFVGYMLCELKCLNMFCFKRKTAEKGFLAIESKERRIRQALAWFITIGFFSFCVMQVLIVMAKKLNICCSDDWAFKGERIVDSEGTRHTVSGSPQIVDTATKAFLILKILSFICEDVAGVALVLSHMAIWYFCEERHVDYGQQELREVHYQHDPEEAAS